MSLARGRGRDPPSAKPARPSPASAPRPHPLRSYRREDSQRNTAYDDEQPIPAPSEPLGKTTQEFCYKSWETQISMGVREDPWIRLLKIPPLCSTEPQCEYELVTVELHDLPPYRAISYAWGNPANTKTVSVAQDGHQGWLEIPGNLGHALLAVQHDTENVLVWVDSICINQKDNRDKTKQLSRIPDIYSNAEQVILWLGVEKDDSAQAHKLLHGLANTELPLNHNTELASVVSLFDRDYWSRLWVVQEILHAKDIVVGCGSSWLPWNDYTSASRLFQSERDTLAKIPSLAPGSYEITRTITSQHRLSPLQVLVHHGPASISHIQKARELYSDNSFSYFLHLLRISRTKLASDPKDRVYGLLGILPDPVRAELRVDYLLPVREIYVDIVEILLQSGDIDVICESIHFPPQISNTHLPSWVPDWSYDPMVRSLPSLPLFFSAGIKGTPNFRFVEELSTTRTRSRLCIVGRRIGTIENHGMAVNTHSRAADYCMAFLQWRILLLQHFGIQSGSTDSDSEEDRRGRVASCEHQRRFCLTLSLGQPIRADSDGNDAEMIAREKEWLTKTYCVFAKTIRSRLPLLPIDEDLMAFAEMSDDEMEPEAARQFLQDSFAEYMMGRCFCITDYGCLGLGTGAMARGDVVAVLYGCSTPVLLRPHRNGDKVSPKEYRFVGDAYIHGYMDGEAMEQGPTEEFLLH